jgi:RNA polymerase sigma-70 factor (ECF subfamily)
MSGALPSGMALNDLDDQELLERVRNGEREAYRPLVERHQASLFRMAFARVRDEEDARDIVQGAFIKAWTHLDGFRQDASFLTWMRRIVENLCTDHARKKIRRKTGSYDDAIATRDEDGTILDGHQADDPAKALHNRHIRERIGAALDQLSEEQRQILLLREIDGLSYKEIAEHIGIPEGTVMSRLFYARKRIQGLLRAEDETP